MKLFFMFILFIVVFHSNLWKDHPQTVDINYNTLCSGKSVSKEITYIRNERLEILGKCYGYANCTACKNCNYCMHCNSGGSCGVCQRYSSMKVAQAETTNSLPNNKIKLKPEDKVNIKDIKSHIPRPYLSTPINKDVVEELESVSTIFINRSEVNLRRLPSINSDIIKVIKRTEAIHLLGRNKHKQIIKPYGFYYWIKVKVDNSKGWIFEPLLDIDRNAVLNLKEIEYPNKYVIGTRVNARSKPTVKSSILFLLNRGEKVEVLKRSDQRDTIKNYGSHYWYFISFTGKEGWIYGGLLN